MNILLKNKYLNIALNGLCFAVVFITGLVIAYLLGMVILAAIALFVAGGIGQWVNNWFQKKYVQLNEKEEVDYDWID